MRRKNWLISGVDKSVFFFNHNHPESSNDMTMSKSNNFEAKMVAGLTRWVLHEDKLVLSVVHRISSLY